MLKRETAVAGPSAPERKYPGDAVSKMNLLK